MATSKEQSDEIATYCGSFPRERYAEFNGPLMFTRRGLMNKSKPSQQSTDGGSGTTSEVRDDLTPGIRESATRLGLSLDPPTILDLWLQLAAKESKTPDELLLLKELELAMDPALKNSLLW